MKRQDYTAEHHALLLGLFGRTLEERYGEYGLDVLANGIIRYGHQRGRRMRERAVRDGRRLDYETFLAYGELRISSGPEDYSTKQESPVYVNCCHRCMWQEGWAKYGLERYGEPYCRYVDISLVQGFNPDMVMITKTAIGLGDDCCTFVNVGYEQTEESRKRIAAVKEELAGKYTKDFLYHSGHLLAALRDTTADIFGAESGDRTAEQTAGAFEKYLDSRAAAELLAEASLDFDRI